MSMQSMGTPMHERFLPDPGATDALGRTQPLNGETRWNPRGYEWNGVERVEIVI